MFRNSTWEHIFPLIKSVRIYNWNLFYSDLVAGITIFFTLVPQGLAYAKLAGFPPVWGLYASTFPLLIYALLGSSRHMAFGPYAVTSFMLGDICSRYFAYFEKGDDNYIQFGLYVSFMTGVMFLLVWALNLGHVLNMVTPSVRSGFLTGCASQVWVHQIPNALGFTIEHTEVQTKRIYRIFQNIGDTTLIAVALTIPNYIFLYFTGRYKRWRNARPEKRHGARDRLIGFLLNFAYFAVIIVGYSVSRFLYAYDPNGKAVQQLIVVGYVPPGLIKSQFAFPTFMPIEELLYVIPSALTITLVGGMSNWSISEMYAGRFGYSVSLPNEMFSSGIVNVIGPLLNGFTTGGGLARTAISVESGAQTQFSNVIAAILVIICLLTFDKEMYYVPLPTLGVITMCGVSTLIDFEKQIQTYRTDKKEAAVMLVTSLCTFWLGVTDGIMFGFIISLLSELYASNYPRVVPVGINASADSTQEKSMQRNDMNHVSEVVYCMGGRTIPHVVVAQIDAHSLYFMNAQYVCSHLSHIALRKVNASAISGNIHLASSASLVSCPNGATLAMSRVLIVDISSITRIDETATLILKKLHIKLQSQGFYVAYVQGDSYYDELLVKNATQGNSPTASASVGSTDSDRPHSMVSRRSQSRKSFRATENFVIRDSILTVYEHGPVVAERTHFSTGPHVLRQLELAGIQKDAQNGLPKQLFPTVAAAVEYYSLLFAVHAMMQSSSESVAAIDEATAASAESTPPSSPRLNATKSGRSLNLVDHVSPLHAATEQRD